MIDNFFPSRWPVMCAVMNGVSDLNLALTINEAGAMPSLLLNRYNSDKSINHDLINDTLNEYRQTTGNVNLVFAIDEEDLFDYQLVKILRHHRVSHVEFLSNDIDSSHVWHRKGFQTALTYLQTTTKIMSRINKPATHSLTQALCIKGKESAGFSGNFGVEDLFQQQKNLTPGCALVPYGGVGTPEQVKNYISKGAAGVAVGTLFAASRESCLSTEVKMAMCRKSSADITIFSDTGQNALVLGEKDIVLSSNTHCWNRSSSLKTGIHGNGAVGHVYAGHSINHVSEIRSVAEIVDYLTQDL
jgi:enoyl-[acyl-carrier protein] reductase II